MADFRRLITQISGVAKRAADEAAVVKYGTVTSRNRDGSLNVDLGNGGCATIAPAANVKIGDRIVIGTTPGLGTVTNLPPQTFEIGPPSDSCPEDPRDLPFERKTLLAASGAQKIASAGFDAWADRDLDQGNGTPSDCSTWFGYKSTSAVTSGNGSVLMNYRKEVIGICPQIVLYTVGRSWIKFDLSGNGVAATGVTRGRLRLSLVAGSIASIHGSQIVVVPGSATLPITVAQMDAFDRSIALGEFLILGGWTTGPNSYGVEVELDLSSYNGELPDPFVLCLMGDFDQSGNTPPQVGSLVDNQDRQDVINFYVAAPNGPPVLELDYATL